MNNSIFILFYLFFLIILSYNYFKFPPIDKTFNTKIAYENIWNKIPLIQCINLKERKDRYNYVNSEFIKIGIPKSRVSFYQPNKHIHGGKYGCTSSHYHCIKKAYLLNLPYTLIFEDDIKFINNDLYNNLLLSFNFINNNNDWDVFMLGSFDINCILSYKTKIEKRKALQAHAYFISRKGIIKLMSILEPMLKNPNNVIQIDSIFEQYDINQYILNEIICIQQQDISDNIWGSGGMEKMTNNILFEPVQTNRLLKNISKCIAYKLNINY